MRGMDGLAVPTSAEAEAALAEATARIAAPDADAESRAWERLDSLTKPARSLGRLEELAARVSTLQRVERPSIARKTIVLMAGDHGVTVQGVSPFPSEVTGQMVGNFAAGGAAINQLSAHAGARLVLVDVGVASEYGDLEDVVRARVADGTADMTRGPAMSREQALSAIGVGLAVAERVCSDGADVVGLGEMGIGNTTAAAAVTAALTGVDPAVLVGPGTGHDAAGVARKAEVVARALEVNRPVRSDGVGVLAAVGGYELAGLAGVAIGCAAAGVPVVADGYITGAAALGAVTIAPGLRWWLFASHRSAEPGHRAVLEALGLEPVLELDMRLGEGTGAALAIEIMDAACAVMSGMATFAEAGVSDRDE